MESLISFLLGLGGSVASAEFEAWAPVISRRLIEWAVLRLPEDEQARRLEEWLAHLNDVPGNFGKLFHSIGCLRAVGKLAAAPAPLARIVEKTPGEPTQSGKETTQADIAFNRHSTTRIYKHCIALVLIAGTVAFVEGFNTPTVPRMQEPQRIADSFGRLISIDSP